MTMMGRGTFSTSGSNCPCPTGGCTCTGNIVFVIGDPWFDISPPARLAFDVIRMLRNSRPEILLHPLPRWIVELCAVPRRMKRPFPPHKPGPRKCRFNFRLPPRSRRSRSRIRATAVRYTQPSRVGEIVPLVGYRAR